MKEVNIFSENEFLIEINNINYIINSQDSLCLKDIENVYIKIFPIESTKNNLPFAIKINPARKEISYPQNQVIVFERKNCYDLFIKPYILTSNICLYTEILTIKNVKYTIYCYEDRVKIFSVQGEYVYECKMRNCSASIKDVSIVILSKTTTNKTALIFDTNKKVFYKIDGKQIEFLDNKIKTLQCLNDSLNHYKLTEYNTKTLEIEKEELYIKNYNNKCNSDYGIICNFIDCVKVKDYSLANTFLKTKLEENVLQQFFGEIDFYRVEKVNKLIIYNDVAKEYLFVINNGQICDIENL